MAPKKAIRLEDSDKILEWTDGSTEKETLELLLNEITERSLDSRNKIIVTREGRIKNFNPNNPTYKQIKYRLSVKELFKMYKDVTGEEYRKLSLEELQRKYRFR